MRFQLDSFRIPNVAGDVSPPATNERGYPADKIPDGMAARDLAFLLTVKARNDAGSSQALKGSHAKAILAILFGTFTMWFGKSKKQLVDEAITLDELRTMIQTCTGRDVLIQNAAGSWVEWNQLGDTDNVVGSTSDGATATFYAMIPRPFAVERLAPGDREKHCPGATQMRALGFKVRRSSGFATGSLVDSKWSQQLDTDVAFGVIPAVSKSDRWVEPVTISRQNVDGTTQKHPGGRLLYFAERSAALASTQLDVLTLRMGDEVVINQGEASKIVTELEYTKPEGYESRAAVETPLYLPPDGTTYEALPTGSECVFDQIGNAEVNPADTVAVLFPQPRSEFVAIVAANIKDEKIPDSEVDVRAPILTNAETKENPGVSQSVAAMAGVAIVKPEHRDYPLTVGEKVTPRGSTIRSIPPAVVRAAKGAASAATTADEKRATEHAASERIAKALPATGNAKRTGALAYKAQEVGRNVLGVNIKG
jgi:hypothetical protein